MTQKQMKSIFQVVMGLNDQPSFTRVYPHLANSCIIKIRKKVLYVTILARAYGLKSAHQSAQSNKCVTQKFSQHVVLGLTWE